MLGSSLSRVQHRAQVVTTDCILTVNPGSSTIKLGMFAVRAEKPFCLGRALIQLRASSLELRIVDATGSERTELIAAPADELDEVMKEALQLLCRAYQCAGLGAVGHRVVHGGEDFVGPVEVTARTLEQIEALAPLAPLHQSQSIKLIDAIRKVHPSLLQTASFDTTFHRTMIPPARRFAIPRELHDAGVRRYGFHGLSYSHIALALRVAAPSLADGRVVVAHLGSGASLCALDGGISRDTSMGFSTLDGVPMSTRCGALDPGVILYLLKERRMSVGEVETLLYNRSGLLGMSGISGDTRVLLASETREAAEALEGFAFHVSRSVAALATTLRGLDGIVFTGGIGEHQPHTRAAICERLGWLGVKLDREANGSDATLISAHDSAVPILIIPADEEQVIAADAVRILLSQKQGGEA